MRKRLSFTATAGLAAIALAAGFAAPAQDARAESWKFALEEVEGSVQHAYAKKFAELVEQKSDGEITVNIFPYGQLGTSGDLTELVQSNAVQITNASPGHLGSIVEEMQVFSIPYVLSEQDKVNKKVLQEADVIYEDLGQSLRDKGLEILTMYPEGDMVWTTNKKVTEPADFDGVKMRTMTSPLLTEAYKAFGATPTPMAYGEVYSALQLGTIDAQVNPIFAIEEMKFYEVQDYMIWAGQQEFTTSVVTGKTWYNDLSEDKREILTSSISEATDYIFEKQREYNKKRLQKIKENKPEMEMIRLSAEQREVFRERAQQVREKYVEMTGESGERILDKLTKAFEEAEAGMSE